MHFALKSAQDSSQLLLTYNNIHDQPIDLSSPNFCCCNSEPIYKKRSFRRSWT